MKIMNHGLQTPSEKFPKKLYSRMIQCQTIQGGVHCLMCEVLYFHFYSFIVLFIFFSFFNFSQETLFFILQWPINVINMILYKSTLSRLYRYVNHCLFCFIKGTNGRQKTYEIFHVYCIFYSGFMCQTTVIFGITKDGSLVFNTQAS